MYNIVIGSSDALENGSNVVIYLYCLVSGVSLADYVAVGFNCYLTCEEEQFPGGCSCQMVVVPYWRVNPRWV